MNNKERWIEETLEGLDGIERVCMDTVLTGRIMSRLKSPPGKVISIGRSIVLRAAAAIVLLVALNAFSVSHFIRSSGTMPQTNASAFSQEYFSYVSQTASF